MGARHRLYLERYLAHMLDGALRVRTEREGMKGVTSLGCNLTRNCSHQGSYGVIMVMKLICDGGVYYETLNPYNI